MVGFIPPMLKHSIHIVTEPCFGHYLLFHGHGSCFKIPFCVKNWGIFVTRRQFLLPHIVFKGHFLYLYSHCVQKTLIITTNNTMQKELYEAPTISIVEMKQEGVICTSGNVNATMDTTWSEEDL